jgi:hypothetical protein
VVTPVVPFVAVVPPVRGLSCKRETPVLTTADLPW